MSPPEPPATISTKEAEAPPCPESSPLWPIVLILAEIATRIERRKAEEHATSDDEQAA